MARRILIGGTVAIVVFLILVLIFILNRNSFEEVKTESAVPQHAILYADNLDVDYFSGTFRQHNLLWQEAVAVHRIGMLDSLFNLFSIHIRQVPVLHELLLDGRLSLSVHLQGKQRLATLFYLETGDDVASGEIVSSLSDLFGKEAIMNERKYEAVPLYDVSLDSESPIEQVSFTIVDGLVILSTSSLLVEEAIRTLHTRSGIGTTMGFKKVAETAGRYVHGNLYVNYSRIRLLLQPLLEKDWPTSEGEFNYLAEWGALDMDFKEDAFLFNGMTVSGDSSLHWLNIFNGQSPVKGEILSVVPASATTVFAAGVSDADIFIGSVKEYYQLSGKHQKLEQADERMKELFGSSPLKDLIGLLGDEITRFLLETGTMGSSSHVVMMEVSSRSRTIEQLQAWAEHLASAKRVDPSTFSSDYVLDPQTTYRIFDFAVDMYGETLPGMFLAPCMAVYDHYLICSDSREAIEQTIYQNVLHKTLANDPSYEYFSEYVSTRSNLTWIVRPGNFLPLMEPQLNTGGQRLMGDLSDLVRKIPAVVFQLSREGSMYYGNVSVTFTGQIKEKALTVWESLLDTLVTMKPVLVVNHNTNEKEILIQDRANTLYLINSTGRILWKMRLDEPVLSDVFQVDYYENGKLQYLFNTTTALHLLDRNGNYVERYPVNLRADATNGMALFDYDNNREYRIMIACSDRDIYAYDLEGNIVTGWSFRKAEGTITRPLQHFRVEEKDYIVCSDAIRSYILNRRGKERVRIDRMPAVSEKNRFYLDMNTDKNQPRLVTTDTAGNVIGIDFSGNTEVILPFRAGPGHFFRLEDLDQDGVPEYIFSRDNELEVIDANGKRVFSFKIKSDISMLPDVYQFSVNDLKLGITDRERNKIYLLNSDGSVYEGFPLEGSTRFSIGYFAGSDSRFNLIVGGDNGFLYNYSIE
jgi:hypothetical protein